MNVQVPPWYNLDTIWITLFFLRLWWNTTGFVPAPWHPPFAHSPKEWPAQATGFTFLRTMEAGGVGDGKDVKLKILPDGISQRPGDFDALTLEPTTTAFSMLQRWNLKTANGHFGHLIVKLGLMLGQKAVWYARYFFGITISTCSRLSPNPVTEHMPLSNWTGTPQEPNIGRNCSF